MARRGTTAYWRVRITRRCAGELQTAYLGSSHAVLPLVWRPQQAVYYYSPYSAARSARRLQERYPFADVQVEPVDPSDVDWDS